MKEYLLKNKNNVAKAAFVFLFQESSGKIPPIPIHIHWHTSGSANDIIASKLKEIRLIMMKLKFIILGFSTDGDAKYYDMYIKP